MGWAKAPDICEPLQPLLYWLMLLWLVPPCVLAGVNGFCGGTDFAKSAYLGGPRFIVASTVSGMVEDGHSTSDALTPLACSSNHLPLIYSRVYCDGGCCDSVELGELKIVAHELARGGHGVSIDSNNVSCSLISCITLPIRSSFFASDFASRIAVFGCILFSSIAITAVEENMQHWPCRTADARRWRPRRLRGTCHSS